MNENNLSPNVQTDEIDEDPSGSVYTVRYNLPPCPDDGPQFPVIYGITFLHRVNAYAHAAESAGRTVYREPLEGSGFSLEDFKDEAAP